MGTLSARANSDLCKLSAWAYQNKLTINKSKTKYVIFNASCRHRSPDLPLVLGGVPLERESRYCYLGIQLDENLNFNAHISSIISACSQKNVLAFKD